MKTICKILASLYALQLLAFMYFMFNDRIETMRVLPLKGEEVTVSLHRENWAFDLLPGLGALLMLCRELDPWSTVELRISHGEWQHRTLVERPDAHFRGWDSMVARQTDDRSFELVVPAEEGRNDERVLLRVYTSCGFPTP